MDGHSQSQSSQELPFSLPQSVEDLIGKICRDQNQAPLKAETKARLFEVGEKNALEALRKVEVSVIRVTFDGFLMYLLKNHDSSPVKRYSMSPSSPPQIATPPRTARLVHNQVSGSTQSLVAEHRQSPLSLNLEEGAGEQRFSPQLMALGELEFRKAFLVLNYLGNKKLEDSITADEIRGLKGFSMQPFESRVWDRLGDEDGNRLKCLDWDSRRTHIYDCHVSLDGSCRFKGPNLEKTQNLLQRVLGDDNVLRVKFSASLSDKRMTISDYWALYKNIAQEGIFVGLRRYRFFVFKDGGKEEKKKDPTNAGVKCYFVRIESNALIDKDQDYILSGKTIQEAREVFMHVHTLPSLARYMSRLALILSKTIKMDFDLENVNIKPISDICCQDENGKVVKDKYKDKPHILSDGTGFISEDLASLCPASISQGVPITKENIKPLMIQFRCFHKGSAIKGTVVLNRKLPARTIQVRPSMVKVSADPKISNVCSVNSFEIVTTSNRPKKTYLNRNLIALLSYGGVPDDFFLDLLMSSFEEMSSISSKKRSSLKAVLQDGEFEDLAAARMILSGIPLDESYLQYRLSRMMNEEKNNLRDGRLPIADSYYVMGTVDPTGDLERDEVCVLLNEGPLSGEVLVYRNPGLHFGDVHVMTARHVEAMHEYVGSAKYGIFFSSKGTRSIADEIAGGDYDGDMYFVSRNHKLLEHYKKSQPWTWMSNFASSKPDRSPNEFSSEDLEDELFKLFLTTRFQPSYTVGIAADSWFVIMDRLLASGAINSEEKNQMKENLLQLIDLYYHALDAPKGGGAKVEVPQKLRPDVYPEYMGKESMPSFKSQSILQKIHDRVKMHLQEKQDNLLNIEVRKLPCFDVPAEYIAKFNEYVAKWNKLYRNFRGDMSEALQGGGDPDAVTQNYRQEFNESAEDAEVEALAIYHVVYDHAQSEGSVEKCHLPWKIAGNVLCKYYIGKTQSSDRTIACSPSVLKDIL